MRKRILKKLLLLLAVLCLAMLQSFGRIAPQMGVLTAEAAAKKPAVEKKHVVYMLRNKSEYETFNGEIQTSYGYQIIGYTARIYIKNLASNAKVTDIKTSVEGIRAFKTDGLNALYVDLDYYRGELQELLSLLPIAITFNVKQGGKTYPLKCNVTFKLREKSFFSSLKIGSLNLTPKTKESLECKIGKIDKTVKIMAKPVSGIKIDEILIYYPGKAKIVKSGQKVNLKDAYIIYIYYQPTQKPKYYKKPTKPNTGGKMPSPLDEEFIITLE